jgi:DNA topoisomerase IB
MTQASPLPLLPGGQAATRAAIELAAAVEADREAALARLCYVDDSRPGWTRRRHGEGFIVLDERGKPVKDEQ